MSLLPSSLPEDLYGLNLSTSSAVAELYNEALGRILRTESDAHQPLLEGLEKDPDFALGHLALAVLSHEFGGDETTREYLQKARELAPRATRREQQFIDAYSHRVAGDYDYLLDYLKDHPRDVLGVCISIPTIAFSGAYKIPGQAWQALEGMASHFDNDWWYDGLLAFARQDQGRMDEALELAQRSLSIEPRGGNAAHAAAHVHLETGRHEQGLGWLDHWIVEAGQDSNHRCHYSWHAALYELSLDDINAVVRRFSRELAPDIVTGARALIDTASFAFRCQLEKIELPGADPKAILAAAGNSLHNPPTPFIEFHCGLALALDNDEEGLLKLRRRCARIGSHHMHEIMTRFVDALLAFIRGDFNAAADGMLAVWPQLVPIGGSYAQREVVLDTAITSLCRAGRGDEAAQLLLTRLERRDRPRDRVLLDRARQSQSA
jgi:tetratricopeptide (TPR) repeat protein